MKRIEKKQLIVIILLYIVSSIPLWPQIIGLFYDDILFKVLTLLSLSTVCLFIKIRREERNTRKSKKKLKWLCIILCIIFLVPTYPINIYNTLSFMEEIQSLQKFSTKTLEGNKFLLLQKKESDDWRESNQHFDKKIYEVKGLKKHLIWERRDFNSFKSFDFEYIETIQDKDKIYFYIISNELVIYSKNNEPYCFLTYIDENIKNSNLNIKRQWILKNFQNKKEQILKPFIFTYPQKPILYYTYLLSYTT